MEKGGEGSMEPNIICATLVMLVLPPFISTCSAAHGDTLAKEYAGSVDVFLFNIYVMQAFHFYITKPPHPGYQDTVSPTSS